MKVLVTGANGFIAKNLIVSLMQMPHIEILKYYKNDSKNKLVELIKQCDFMFHLAGVNRPKDNKEFYTGNRDLTQIIVDILKEKDKKVPILLTSSTQVNSDSDYGKSKEEAEKIVENYSKEIGVPCFIYRLSNVFGKWSKPNYNTVIATWCYNIARDKEIEIKDRDIELTLVYVGDVVHSFLDRLYVNNTNKLYYKIETIYKKTLGEIVDLLYRFKASREDLLIPNIARGFERILYATYLSFLPTDKFSYKLGGYKDARGAFYEILKTVDSGQLGISTTKPGVTRGNHYHNTKNEKFLVIKGEALIELRDVFSDSIIQYNVSGDELEIVEMIPGYTHNIKNIGNEEMVLLIWANENYNSEAPDTNFLEV